MADACLVHLVQACDQLHRVGLHHRNWKFARVSYSAEQITVWGKFVGDAGQLLILNRFYKGFDRPSSEGVRSFRREAYLSVKLLHGHFWCVLEYFEGKVLSIFLCFEDVGCSAGTYFVQ